MNIEHDLIIGVFDGGSHEVLLLDLAFLNLKFYKIDSEEFIQWVNSIHYYYPISAGSTELKDFTSTMFHHLQHDQPGGFHPYLYALVPLNIADPLPKEIFFKVDDILSIMFPSDFQLTNLVFYDAQENGKYAESYMNSWDFESHWYLKDRQGSLDELRIKIDGTQIEATNLFLKKIYDFISKDNDFEIAIDSYAESFTQRSAKMAYINLCIALEALVKSEEGEITFKICRTAAVINADDKTQGQDIFFNTKQFYALRSRIVHGDKINLLPEYLFNLRALLSRTLIEIITLDIPDRETLYQLVNENGYGDKNRFASKYVKENFNKPVADLAKVKVTKYKR